MEIWFRASIKALLICFLYCVELPHVSLAEGDSDLKFIVNKDNPVSSISTKDLNDYFFKKKREWPDGNTVRFIDSRNNSPIRNNFLQNFLKKNSNDVELYWVGQKLYTGDSAPVQSFSDTSTIQYVATFKGAIGYIKSSQSIENKPVKTIIITPE